MITINIDKDFKITVSGKVEDMLVMGKFAQIARDIRKIIQENKENEDSDA